MPERPEGCFAQRFLTPFPDRPPFFQRVNGTGIQLRTACTGSLPGNALLARLLLALETL